MREYILIIEDDNDINRMLKELLEGQGYETAQAFSGTEALLYMERRVPDGVILDLMLPGLDGEEVLKYIKTQSPDTAVLVSSAKEELQVRVSLLKAGADDYLVKPFDTQELLARLEAVLRRLGGTRGCKSSGKSAPARDAAKAEAFEGEEGRSADRSCSYGSAEQESREDRKLIYRELVMCPEDFAVTLDGKELSLTKREFLILQLLMENPGKVFTKSNIYESVWNEEFLGEDNAVNVHISNIRQKIAKIKPEENYIQTVWGIGFKMK